MDNGPVFLGAVWWIFAVNPGINQNIPKKNNDVVFLAGHMFCLG